MPVSNLGQLITFAIERDRDVDPRKWVFADVRVGDTIRQIAAERGHPEEAWDIARRNDIRSVQKVLLHKPHRKGDIRRIRVPGNLAAKFAFSVLAGDQPPRVVDGYARFGTVARPLRTGLTVFEGYNPTVMEVPVRFDAFAAERTGDDIERDIELLERMAGRGDYKGAGAGPPAVVRLSTTGAEGGIVPLIPERLQWSRGDDTSPLWRIVGIDWDADALRNEFGKRTRQLAVVTVQQHTNLKLLSRSASERNRKRGKAGDGAQRERNRAARAAAIREASNIRREQQA